MKSRAENKNQPSVDQAPESASSWAAFIQSSKFYWILLGLAIVVLSLMRLRFLDIPLERDEGEYAYFGQLILNGIAPYSEAYNLKLPGVYYMYALIMAVFGQTHSGIHTGLLVLNAGTMILLFAGMKRWFSPITGLLTAGLYGTLAMGIGVFGFAAHATQFVVFFLALALLLLGMFADSQKLLHALLSGVGLGMAFLMKQQAVYFLVMGGILVLGLSILGQPRDLKKTLGNAGLYTVGVFTPYMLVVLLMLASGSFAKFWYWTVEYAGKYAEGQSWALGKKSLSENWGAIWAEQWPIWALAFAGIGLLWATKFTARQRLLATALLVFGALATTPSFYFRQHYFVVALPAVALLAAVALEFAGRHLARLTKLARLDLALPVLGWVVMLLLIVSGAKFNYYYGADDPDKLCKAIYGANPFVESLVIADYLQKNTSENDKIAVLGSEPQIPFYAQRHSATGYIYFYPLMEDQPSNLKMQEEMIAEIERNKPKYFVYVNIGTSLGRTPKSPMRIFDWAERYMTSQFNQVGLIEVAEKGTSQYFWDAAAARHMPQGQHLVYVFRRR